MLVLQARREFARTVFLFAVAVVINYPWELAQSRLYKGVEDFSVAWWHCGIAALGDGILVLLIHAVGLGVFRKKDWFGHPGTSEFAVMSGTGLVIGVSVEWVAVYIARRWTYKTSMPLVPVLGVGLVPVLQMLVLPPIIFRIVAAWRSRTSAAN